MDNNISRMQKKYVIIFLLGLIYGCNQHGPWPSVTVLTNNLGKGRIADYIIKNMFNEDAIKKIEVIFPQSIDRAKLGDIENEFGFKCLNNEIISCNYHGFIVNEFQANWSTEKYKRTVNINIKWDGVKKAVSVDTFELHIQ